MTQDWRFVFADCLPKICKKKLSTPISFISAAQRSGKLNIPFTKIGSGGGLIELEELGVSEVEFCVFWGSNCNT